MSAEAARGRVAYNFIANFVGRVVVTGIAILTAPIYMYFLGLEAYGLIGLSVSINALSALFDLGLSTTVTREVARREPSDPATKDMIATYETIYLALGMVFLCAIVLASGWIARDWVQTQSISSSEAGLSISLMAIGISANFMGLCYTGALLGTGQHRPLNIVLATSAILQHGGALLVLLFVSRTLEAFFLWQGSVKTLQIIAMRYLLYRGLSQTRAGRFRFSEILQTWRFSLSMNVIAFMSLALSQADSVVLSKILPLNDFGKYSLAKTAAQGLTFLILPLFNSFFPKIVQQFQRSGFEDAKGTYHQFSQVMAICILPMGATICAFPAALLLLWTGSSEISNYAGMVLALLTAGTAINGLMYAPYMLLLASAAVRYLIVQCALLALITVPLTIMLAHTYGAVGAASTWLIVNLLLMVVGQPILHRVFLKGDLTRWWLYDILPTASICAVLAIVARLLIADPASRLSAAILLALMCIVIQAAVLLAAPPNIKAQIKQLIKVKMGSRR